MRGWELVGGGGGGRRVGAGRRGAGSGVRFGAVPNSSVRYGSGRFDTILGESIVETAMV